MTSPKPWISTPLIESAVLSEAAKCKVLLKIETLQPGRSFKSRGMGNFMLARLKELEDRQGRPPIAGDAHFYSSSGGNAGLAAVRAAVTLGHPCTVVVPMSTKQRMIDIIRTAGAHNVIQVGDSWREADTHLREDIIAKDPTGIYVPPFDHPDVWAGNSTMIHEIADQWQKGGGPPRPKPKAVVCSVGGGGLFCGIIQGLQERGWADVPVLAVETAGADSFSQSVAAGELVTLPGITSQAKTLGATRCSAQALHYAQSRSQVKSIVLSDSEAAMGCVRLADDERLMVELSCGVNVAMCFGDRLHKALGHLDASDEVIVVVCGGSDVTIEQLQEWRAGL